MRNERVHHTSPSIETQAVSLAETAGDPADEEKAKTRERQVKTADK